MQQGSSKDSGNVPVSMHMDLSNLPPSIREFVNAQVADFTKEFVRDFHAKMEEVRMEEEARKAGKNLFSNLDMFWNILTKCLQNHLITLLICLT